ncbi:hypothetical protein [Nocardia sp. NPDC050413]|uniref:hypothetical protein n=1 Tax=Nocardia sp. NPDC050413 TaxID=3155784 RepID=UPI0033EA921D
MLNAGRIRNPLIGNSARSNSPKRAAISPSASMRSVSAQKNTALPDLEALLDALLAAHLPTTR